MNINAISNPQSFSGLWSKRTVEREYAGPLEPWQRAGKSTGVYYTYHPFSDEKGIPNLKELGENIRGVYACKEFDDDDREFINECSVNTILGPAIDMTSDEFRKIQPKLQILGATTAYYTQEDAEKSAKPTITSMGNSNNKDDYFGFCKTY